MAIHQLTISVPYFTGLARDVITNTFYFVPNQIVTPPVEQDYIDLDQVVRGLYEDLYQGGGDAFTAANHLDWTQVRTTIYDLSQPTPRVPVYEDTDALTVVTNASSLTLEAAMVVSYRAEYQSGENRASQRGRVYLGGMTQASVSAGSASTFPRWSSTICGQVAGIFADFATKFDSVVPWYWHQYSRKLGVSKPIVAGWVDDEIDTQRRRGNVFPNAPTPFVAAQN